MKISVKTFVCLSMLFICISSYSGTTKIDIEFKGKKEINYSDVCSDKGRSYDGNIIPYYGQYECFPKLKNYADIDLLKKLNDACDSSFTYDPATGNVIQISLKFSANELHRLVAILKEKYGNPSVNTEKMFSDAAKNERYYWEDTKGSSLKVFIEIAKNYDAKVIIPPEIRRCSVIEIETSSMIKLRQVMKKNSEYKREKSIKDAAKSL